ncbi:Uncharacterised protein [Candidatus Gugararchaeum adminiculabundum]|nr:Uncharacterised protein [Candidatus Gugararchaeum adminiculabundum]
MKIPYEQCVTCKGTKRACGLASCPILDKLNNQLPRQLNAKEVVFGPTPPNAFVGSYGYPNVYYGPMVSISEDKKANDSPVEWYGKASYNDIINFTSSMLRSKKVSGIFAPRDKSSDPLLEKTQETVLSTKNIDVEVEFKNKPKFQLKFSPVTAPLGPDGMLKNFKVCDNPVIPKRVDEILEENLLATQAIDELYSHGHDVYYLTKIMSTGILGKQKNKKLVPTRWSITATDDIVSKQLLPKIRESPEISDFEVYTAEFLHNHFEILLMPGKWEFEQFEAWAPGTLWAFGAPNFQVTEDHEPFTGKKDYSNQAGGYYASRLAVSEHLNRRGKQARALVFREIYEGYIVPVGVWEVRENARHALASTPKKFSTLPAVLEYLQTRLRVPLSKYTKKSEILRQSRLSDF